MVGWKFEIYLTLKPRMFHTNISMDQKIIKGYMAYVVTKQLVRKQYCSEENLLPKKGFNV